MLFRPQIGGLQEAMRHQRELPDRAALAKHLRDSFDVELVTVELYLDQRDPRIEGWDRTFLVTAKWRGGMVAPIGYTNEAVDG